MRADVSSPKWMGKTTRRAKSFELARPSTYMGKAMREALSWVPVRRPTYTENIPRVAQTCFDNPALEDWYSPVLIGPGTIGASASSPDCVRHVIRVLQQLEPDDYVRYLSAYYDAALSRFGDHWRYADITTVLLAASQLIRPTRYLEIGVRRGRSMAVVAATCPECQIIGFDLWVAGYGSADNPGPDLVRKELGKVGHKGTVEFVSGDSHKTLPRYLKQHHDMYFDLITVDGDHSIHGASLDLRDVLPRLCRGGCIVFDDIAHPLAPGLAQVWHRFVASDSHFATWEFTELGYGVGLGIRV